MEIEQLLELAVQQGASDLHLRVGRPPVLRIHGRMRTIKGNPLTNPDITTMAHKIMSGTMSKDLETDGSVDFGFAFRDLARFRASVFREKNGIGVVLRQIPNTLLTFEQIGLPDAIKSYLARPRGLILVTGPTGSGKSTSLATMVDYINTNYDRHIITIEDPIEFYHEHKKSIITQREVGPGRDVPSFAEGLRRALRQDPDVILVGEMRDLETISAGIQAAETGHLVFGTLHTTGSARTITRIVDAYPTSQQAQVRTQLSVALSMVISQALLPKAAGSGRVAAFEVLMMTTGISSLIRENKIPQIENDILTNRKMGMILMDDFLMDLYTEGKVTAEEAIAKAVRPETLTEKIQDYEKQRRAAAAARAARTTR